MIALIQDLLSIGSGIRLDSKSSLDDIADVRLMSKASGRERRPVRLPMEGMKRWYFRNSVDTFLSLGEPVPLCSLRLA